MVKLYLDANGLAPIAQALSGQSRQAGVAAGLENQMRAAQLDEQRFKQQQAYQAQERKDSMGLSAIAQALPGFSAAQVNEIQKSPIKSGIKTCRVVHVVYLFCFVHFKILYLG